MYPLGDRVVNVPLELEVYKAWKETVYELVGDTLAGSIEERVIHKLAHALQHFNSEALTRPRVMIE
jgi:hypothetical protein